jgi:predicted type IV restriction endonuclease
VKTSLRKFQRPLSDLRSRDANEGDTRLFVTDFLCEALGYDKYSDLTTEYRVRGEFADFGLRVDKQMVAFIEVKRIASKLGKKHLRQVETYALNEGIEWVILTNGAEWQVYHITAALPIEVELALTVDLLSDETLAEKARKMFYISSEALKRRQIDELWQARRATAPPSLARALTADKVVEELRKELRRQTGHRATAEEVVTLLRETVFRAECFE